MIQLNIWAFIAAILVSLLVGFALGRVGTGPTSQSKLPAQSPMSLDLSRAPIGELRALLMAGRKIEAIKRLRAETGIGLKEAKDAVDSMAVEMSAPGNFDGTGTPLAGNEDYTRQPLLASSASSSETTPAPTPDTIAEIRQLIVKKNKIAAIKLYRKETGVGLREAKEAVERLEVLLHQQGQAY